jgi:Ca2+-binding RTX toxin-like protein
LYGDRESSDGLFDTSNGNGYGYDDASFSGNDILDGGAGNDRLYGRSGNDKLLGGDGNDVLAGGLGVDQMTGGSGTDYFVFALLTASPGNDKLVDFKSGEDKLWFDTDVYTALSGITEENYTTAAKAGADDYLFYYKSKLYYDADADGSGSAVLIAKIRSFDFDDLAFGTDHTAITL